jgi:hypothetical protein
MQPCRGLSTTTPEIISTTSMTSRTAVAYHIMTTSKTRRPSQPVLFRPQAPGHHTTLGYVLSLLTSWRKLIVKQHETDFPSPYATSTLSSDTHALNNLDGHHTEALGGTFISYQSDPRYNSPYAAPQSSRSHPPSPLPAPSWTGTSISILPSTILTSYHASSILPSTTPEGYHDSNNSIQCKHCSRWFHGKYCHGNLARHVKHQHTGSHERPFACTAAGCSKTFRRQDARLKHARNKHPGLSLPPVPRRRFEGSEQHPRAPDASVLVPDALNLDYNVGQWSYADQVFDSHHMSKPVHETPLASIRDESACPAHYIFTALRANLETVEYNRVRDSFFTRWESIVQQLGDDQ